MTYILQVKAPETRTKYIEYKSRKAAESARDRYEKQSEEIICKIFKDVTYGDQVSLFESQVSPF